MKAEIKSISVTILFIDTFSPRTDDFNTPRDEKKNELGEAPDTADRHHQNKVLVFLIN